jgi:hypothetical protein
MGNNEMQEVDLGECKYCGQRMLMSRYEPPYSEREWKVAETTHTCCAYDETLRGCTDDIELGRLEHLAKHWKRRLEGLRKRQAESDGGR